MRKKIDNRIRTLIENGVISGHRSLVVIVGDHGRDQVTALFLILLFNDYCYYKVGSVHSPVIYNHNFASVEPQSQVE